MTRRIIKLVLLISLVLVLFTLPTVHAQTKEKFVVDTGIVTLPSTHELRITAVAPSVNDTMTVAFRRLRYQDSVCNSDGVCKNEIAADDSTGPLVLTPGEAASFKASTVAPFPSLRVMVVSNNRDVRVTAELINQTTGEIVAIWVPQGSPLLAKP